MRAQRTVVGVTTLVLAAITASCSAKLHLRELATCSSECETEFAVCHNFQKANRNKNDEEAYAQCISEINNSQGVSLHQLANINLCNQHATVPTFSASVTSV